MSDTNQQQSDTNQQQTNGISPAEVAEYLRNGLVPTMRVVREGVEISNKTSNN